MHVYEVLAQPIRRRIVEVLASGEHTAGVLENVVVREFHVTRAAAQHHLRLLKDHDVVIAESDWPHRSYRLNDHFISYLELEAQKLRWFWDRRIGWRVRAEQVVGFHLQSGRGYRGSPPWILESARARAVEVGAFGEKRRRQQRGHAS
ncbi:ArsR/SmtB family transcription factor [Lacisediminihabitans changchengi]|uniref:Winged helix-turn-helix transcriptional regulator n=1 Tax=Lacisediminihabitans changchengi TaxID=2787634 RepID=A0A934SLJ7_9MICO|nr:winged helix-turn-helix domain-containing protein [Lacisediminihabitans changchengi]MBK4347172.1 winged helix-turn-helix transcriptional regulator [Lacisediminihabitans changchengi]